jgi:hypothetical protein
MAVTIEDATNEIYTVIRTAWASACTAAGVPVGELIFDTRGTDGNPTQPQSGPWARVGSSITDSKPRSIGGIVWQTDGLASIHMHFPQKTFGESAGTIAQRFAEVIARNMRVYRGGHVNFLTATPGRKGPDGPFYRYDVTATFRYYSRSEG